MAITFLQAVRGAAALSAGAGAVFSGISGSRSARESRRSRKAAAEIAAGGLKFAKEIFELFEPSIQQLGDFFAETDINDVLEGRVVSPVARAEVGAANILFSEEDRRIRQNLAQRGLGDQPEAAEAVAANLRTPRTQTILDILGRGFQQDLDRRERFATAGTRIASGIGNQFANLAQTLLGTGGAAQRQADLAGAAGGAGLGSLFNILLRRREETGNPRTFDDFV